MIFLYQTFQNLDKESALNWIYDIISEYKLSLVSRNGYAFYGCQSYSGLGDYNRESFNRLRTDFNNCKILDYRYYVMMYVAIVYAFNNQIRSNSSGEFNLPVGKRDFNSRMRDKLIAFIEKIQITNCHFIRRDFRFFDTSTLIEDDFVYADSPYLITCATYNENGGWNNNAERDLLQFLDSINSRGIRFALFNVLTCNGKNKTLLDWLNTNSYRYKVFHVQHSYSNSNYHKSDKISATDEVLIVNYTTN